MNISISSPSLDIADFIVATLAECMVDKKENIDANLLASFRNGNPVLPRLLICCVTQFRYKRKDFHLKWLYYRLQSIYYARLCRAVWKDKFRTCYKRCVKKKFPHLNYLLHNCKTIAWQNKQIFISENSSTIHVFSLL